MLFIIDLMIPHNGMNSINNNKTNHLAPRYAVFSFPPLTSSLLVLNILLNTMLSNTLSFLSSRNVNDQVSHPYKTTGKIIVLYILIFIRTSLLHKKNVHCLRKSPTHVTLPVRKINDIGTKACSKITDKMPRNDVKDKLK